LEVPAVINVHGFANGGKTFPIGISQLIDVMGMEGMISATDVYPGVIGEGNFHQLLLVNEMTKALQDKHQPLFSIEFQAGGNQDFSNGQSSLYDLHTRLCISSGMRAVNHYLFCDGENNPVLSPTKRHNWGHPVRKDGTLRKHYFRYPLLSKVLNSYGPDLVLSQPRTVTTIGFLLDYFMTEVNNKVSQESSNIITHQRDMVLFDLIARGLTLTHRPFDAVEISRDELDVARIPLLWVMMERQCNADTQQKLADYLSQGGRLILAGRMCTEEFDHTPCTILKDALGIQEMNSDLPFTWIDIHIFNDPDVPVSFVETYSGEFDDVFARKHSGAVVGFIKQIGKGKVMLFGAALAANTLDDLDVVDQMALKMDCPSLFTLGNWADVRLSHADNGSFLFINNYQDDPLETTIEIDNENVLGGHSVHIPARRGLILPIDWQLNNEVMIHYVTSEIVEITNDGAMILLKTAQEEFFAEITLSNYRCDDSITLEKSADTERVRVHGKQGVIVLNKDR
jgi:beta-galactosidase